MLVDMDLPLNTDQNRRPVNLQFCNQRARPGVGNRQTKFLESSFDPAGSQGSDKVGEEPEETTDIFSASPASKFNPVSVHAGAVEM